MGSVSFPVHGEGLEMDSSTPGNFAGREVAFAWRVARALHIVPSRRQPDIARDGRLNLCLRRFRKGSQIDISTHGVSKTILCRVDYIWGLIPRSFTWDDHRGKAQKDYKWERYSWPFGGQEY